MLKIAKSRSGTLNKALSITITFTAFFLSGWSTFGSDFSVGPAFDEFPLTIGDGERKEIFGPFYYSEHNDSEKIWALPPFFSHQEDPTIDEIEDQSFYPIFSYVKYGTQYRVQFLELISFAGGENPGTVQAPGHALSDLLPTALVQNQRRLYRCLSLLRTGQKCSVSGQNFLRHVPRIQRNAFEGRCE
jgi:hypothetical protein